MNSVITFFVGCAAFAVMMLVKIPIKKLNWELAKSELQYKRLNFLNNINFFGSNHMLLLCIGLAWGNAF